MNRKWMPKTAGILEIIHGSPGILFGIVSWLILIPFAKHLGSVPWYYDFLGPAIIIVGIIALVGGIYTIKRKVWILALAGAVAAFALTLWSLESWINIKGYIRNIDSIYDCLNVLRGFAGIPAIFAIILTVLSRKQFSKSIQSHSTGQRS